MYSTSSLQKSTMDTIYLKLCESDVGFGNAECNTRDKWLTMSMLTLFVGIFMHVPPYNCFAHLCVLALLVSCDAMHHRLTHLCHLSLYACMCFLDSAHSSFLAHQAFMSHFILSWSNQFSVYDTSCLIAHPIASNP